MSILANQVVEKGESMEKDITELEPIELAHKISDIQKEIKLLMKTKKKYQVQLKKLVGKRPLQKLGYAKVNTYFEKPIFLYALKLEQDYYYIGMSRDPDKRFKRHLKGKGSMWTKEHKPLEIVETRPTHTNDDSEASKMEDVMTLEYAEQYGYNKVRGGGYCQRKPLWPRKSPTAWIKVQQY